MAPIFKDISTRSEQTVGKVLAERVRQYGEKTWVICNDEEYTYRNLHSRSNQLARGMLGLGIGQDDTVLLMMENDVEIITAWIALAKLGAMEVPVNTELKGSLLAHILNDSQSTTLVVHETFLERIYEIESELKLLTDLVVVRSTDQEERMWPVFPRFNIVRLNQLYSTDSRDLEMDITHRHLLAVMYTSGTTGASKGVMITHAHAYEYALGVVELLALREDDVYYNPLPLFHIAGQWAGVYATMIAGATVLVPGKFSLEKFWPQVIVYGCTATFLLGAMANWLYRRECNEADKDNPMERMLVVPLLPEIEDFKRRFGVKVSTTWGSTEINVPTRSSFDLANNKTCGRIAEDRYQVRIVNEYDEEVPSGEPGEALVRSNEPWILMAGYWNNPEATAKAWKNQWVHTGDMLMKDDDGNLYFIDRSKDAIRRRGENISSMEVENEVNAHASVLECAVIPVESEYSEQEVMAVIVPRQGVEFDPVELIAFLKPRMAAFMIPRYIEVVKSLPKTATGKIQKFSLRERGVTESTWDRELPGNGESKHKT